MTEFNSIEDISALREACDVECKLAIGRDGKGALPNDIWETYSAFANTEGGEIFLGLKEKPDHSFELNGVEDTEKVLTELWNGLNNLQKVSCNLLRERNVNVLVVEGLSIIHVHVPQANRKQKPVYINNNPMTGSFKRMHSGDMRLDSESVRRMLAEQVEDSRDSEILRGFGIDDLDTDAVNAYRNMYAVLQPDHPWNKLDVQSFLFQIGAWGKDRETGFSGITRAGLLMFGTYRPIMEAFPNFMVDFQERPEANREVRWIDRVVPDGSWSGNLFDFYHKVIRKLTADLKVPFVLEGVQRKDDTLVHIALREALVNTLIHADYTGRASILVVKRPDMFGFRNPGLMRVPIEQAIQGSQSDCRNRTLQNMFRFIGLGENAGSGLHKIFDGWRSQHWRKPLLREKSVPSEQTLLELHTLSLIPEAILLELRDTLIPDVFDKLNDNERLVLVTAKVEKTIDHKRIMQILDIHPRDLSKLLGDLVDKGLLLQDGIGRGTVYFLPEARFDDEIKELIANHSVPFIPPLDDLNPGSGGLGGSSGGLGGSSGGLGVSSGGLGVSSGGLISNSELLAELKVIAAPVANRKKAAPEVVEKAILKLCELHECKLEELAALLNRSPSVIRKYFIKPLINQRKLRYKYPTKPNHPEQAYITVMESQSND